MKYQPGYKQREFGIHLQDDFKRGHPNITDIVLAATRQRKSKLKVLTDVDYTAWKAVRRKQNMCVSVFSLDDQREAMLKFVKIDPTSSVVEEVNEVVPAV